MILNIYYRDADGVIDCIVREAPKSTAQSDVNMRELLDIGSPDRLKTAAAEVCKFVKSQSKSKSKYIIIPHIIDMTNKEIRLI